MQRKFKQISLYPGWQPWKKSKGWIEDTVIQRSVIDNNFKNTNVIVATIPYRHDGFKYNDLNDKIRMVNAYIEELSIRKPNVHLLHLDSLERDKFNNYGVHMNRKGKHLAAKLILQMVTNKSFDRACLENKSPHT
jgi:hypothetical protein